MKKFATILAILLTSGTCFAGDWATFNGISINKQTVSVLAKIDRPDAGPIYTYGIKFRHISCTTNAWSGDRPCYTYVYYGKNKEARDSAYDWAMKWLRDK